MKISKLKAVYFSPSGGTEKVTKAIATNLGWETYYYNLLDKKIDKKLKIHDDECLLLVMPSFSGRVPEVCLHSLKYIHGDNRPAIIVTVYGNRDYEDTLAEMEDIIISQGLKVLAGGAFVAEHSLFPSIAEGRPDEQDLKEIKKFATKCVKKIEKIKEEKWVSSEGPEIPGNRPYKKYGKTSVFPSGDSDCNKCKTCVTICPVGAISKEKPKKTDEKKCIMCTACVAHCPKHARKFSGMAYNAGQKRIAGKCSERKEPEFFI